MVERDRHCRIFFESNFDFDYLGNVYVSQRFGCFKPSSSEVIEQFRSSLYSVWLIRFSCINQSALSTCNAIYRSWWIRGFRICTPGSLMIFWFAMYVTCLNFLMYQRYALWMIWTRSYFIPSFSVVLRPYMINQT